MIQILCPGVHKTSEFFQICAMGMHFPLLKRVVFLYCQVPSPSQSFSLLLTPCQPALYCREPYSFDSPFLVALQLCLFIWLLCYSSWTKTHRNRMAAIYGDVCRPQQQGNKHAFPEYSNPKDTLVQRSSFKSLFSGKVHCMHFVGISSIIILYLRYYDKTVKHPNGFPVLRKTLISVP